MKVIVDAIKGPMRSTHQLEAIPDDAKVIANHAASLLLFGTSIVWRLWLANQMPPPDFDFIVAMPSEVMEIGPALLGQSDVCYEDALWQIRCRRNGRYDLRKQKTGVIARCISPQWAPS